MKRAIITAALLCSCGWYAYTNAVLLWPRIGDSPSDFAHHHRAARRVVSGDSPYVDAGYDYPPLAAFAAVPVARLDYASARKVWFILSHVSLLIAAWLVWRALGGDLAAACCVAGVWSLGGAAGENLDQGQLGPLLTMLLAVAYTRGAPAGRVAAALGLGLKFIPGVLAVAWGLERNHRALTVFAAAAAVSLALPWAVVGCGLNGPARPSSAQYWMGTPAVLSWSAPSTVLRILDPARQGDALPHAWQYGNTPSIELPPAHRLASVATAAAILGCGILAVGWACRWRLRRESVPWAMAAVTSLGLAAAPICWTHYQIMQYPGLALLLTRAFRVRKWALAAGASALGALLYPVPVAVLRSYYESHGSWTAASPATLYLWTSVTPVACLGLFVVLVAQAAAVSRGYALNSTVGKK